MECKRGEEFAEHLPSNSALARHLDIDIGDCARPRTKKSNDGALGGSNSLLKG